MPESHAVVCILGMHRSGTSMVSHVLHLCGLDLGPQEALMPPTEANPLGYWEHVGFVEVNDALLSALGGSWDVPPAFPEQWETDPTLKPVLDRARDLIASFGQSPRWGWKDPRTAMLLPFWKSLIPDLRFVICLRNPLEVAESLARRDRMSVEQAAHLWGRYLRATIRETEGWPRLFVFYEDFFEEAAEEVDRLARFCGLAPPRDPTEVRKAIAVDLKHQTSDMAGLLSSGRIPLEEKLAYTGLRALCARTGSEMRADGTHEARVSASVTTWLGLIDQLQGEPALARKNAEIDRIHAELATTHRTLFHERVLFAGLEATLESECARLNETIRIMTSTRGWRLLERYRRIRARLDGWLSAVRSVFQREGSGTR